MGFTTQTFLFVFFPICILAYCLIDGLERLGGLGRLLVKLRCKDLLLIGFSLGFYMWAVRMDAIRLLCFSVLVYLLGLLIDRIGKKTKTKWLFALSVVLLLAILIYYKYFGFMVSVWNILVGTNLSVGTILAPLGISFITFSAISYIADVARGKATAGSLIDCVLYLTFFPKVVSGPIVLWQNFQKQIAQRSVTFDLSFAGVNQIMIGFAKKILLADTFGICLAQIGTAKVDGITVVGTIVLYFLQIYYDFAGYSDIAIGLSKLFGFSFEANFRFPYRSTSISEFWRHWHISLGSWFREYVYFPLGGSRVSKIKTLRNLAVVFALTGIWHGAGWNYILWGGINAVAVVIERLIQKKTFYQKTPSVIKYAVTMLIVMLFWQLFRYQSLGDIRQLFMMLFNSSDSVHLTWQYYFDTRVIVLAVIALLGATVFGDKRVIACYQKWVAKPWGLVLQEVALLILFVLAVLFMINSTYSPFIYFQY